MESVVPRPGTDPAAPGERGRRPDLRGGRSDALALVGLHALLALLLVASWGRWTNPIIDHGREMNVPARILAGERLYTDVQFLYGPFAPHFNALLYRLLGVRLASLHASGIVCAILVLWLVYGIARKFMGAWESALATALGLALCGLQPGVGYVQPYAYAALYGFVFGLGSLAAVLSFLERERARSLVWAGALTGLASISKPEMAAASLAAAAVAIALVSIRALRPRLDLAAAFGAPAIAIAASAWGAVLLRVPWHTLRDENHIAFTNMPSQLYYFNLGVAGLADWRASLGIGLCGVGGFVLLAGISGTVGALGPEPDRAARRSLLARSSVALAAATAWWILGREMLGIKDPPSPVHASSLFLLATLGVAGQAVWRAWRGRRPFPYEERSLLVVIPFALLCLGRTALNVRAVSAYAPFALPVALLVLVHALVVTAPSLLTPSESLRRRVRRTASLLVAVALVGTALKTVARFRTQLTYEVVAPRGSFLTEPKYGRPLSEAIGFVRGHTSPDDFVLTLPEGTAINFLAERPYPLREEIVHPGFLTGDRERETIRRVASLRVPLVLVSNRLMTEFRDPAFGMDYNQEFMRWITEHYHPVARFDSAASRGASFGDRAFFIVAYARDP